MASSKAGAASSIISESSYSDGSGSREKILVDSSWPSEILPSSEPTPTWNLQTDAERYLARLASKLERIQKYKEKHHSSTALHDRLNTIECDQNDAEDVSQVHEWDDSLSDAESIDSKTGLLDTSTTNGTWSMWLWTLGWMKCCCSPCT
ncbi:hypothetical protein, variant [Spizellomyces punctatus DAOM BR117]|uniref:Uncharacterized protein n=1 Tax=Spizellomyces punctatus (strain DAOM BR117) TaxID=645134 RepID=A0A0L0HSW6_SPIPD|nr:hypothetical protein, variant [Spizellomyces punctatus DAOM BR117]KND03969.1 hypothetical protein, variant [Spizellomyces punctatus DAOM BR117]|eukprot:XP_016612008.1 hypothetical protein, variant [Spizellomyces punctatus DAOM BR117]